MAATKTAPTKRAAKPAAKPAAERCRYGQGAYGSPKSMARCTNPRPADKPNRQLCDEHEALWRVEAKKRRAARLAEQQKAEPKAKAKAAPGRKPPAPSRQPVKRVPFAEPQPAIVQLVPPEPA